MISKLARLRRFDSVHLEKICAVLDCQPGDIVTLLISSGCQT
ncbi:helix-turn-helix domain-containing protein [Lactiplantibacillus paraplantarum]|nr:helix-turn-helix domain-containing protein [Lactiplantibacillus paraplantarum]RDG12653.1 hypothetical protein DQM08_04360 [Lactiplantibacillus paraplantarum]